jgi:hypothetical protein
MANENLIAYQQQIKQINLDNITGYEQTLASLDEAIIQMNNNIEGYNTQKIEYEGKITEAEAGNVLIDETISILEQM